MAFDTFMYFDPATGVEGETTDSVYAAKKGIEIYSFSWGASNPTTVSSGATGLSAGKVSISSFNVMKKTEASSAGLFTACCNGQHFAKLVVDMRRASGPSGKQMVFLTYTFTDVMVESIQWSGSAGGDETPTESVSFAFGKVDVSYQQMDDKGEKKGGAKTASWNLTTIAKD